MSSFTLANAAAMGLLSLMERYSEDYWSAGWMMNLEYTLWRYVSEDLDQSEIKAMKILAEAANGWWIWDGERKFVPMDEWLVLYAASQRPVRVVYHHNNSGGRDWLGQSDWDNLQHAGWHLSDRMAIKIFPTLEAGKQEWSLLTGQDPDTEGCYCCGQPHNFWEESA